MKKDLIQIVTEMYNPNYMVVYHVSPTTIIEPQFYLKD